MKPHLDYDIAIIGGGVIGLSIAISLQQAGKTVIIIDQDDEQINASRKNAGAFAFADIVPLATPHIIKSAPKWFFDPEGPLYIHPAYLLSIFLKFTYFFDMFRTYSTTASNNVYFKFSPFFDKI